MTPDKPTTPPAPGPSTPATGSYHYLFQRVQIVGDLQSLPWRKINTTRRVHVRFKSTPDNPRTICGEPFDFIERGSTLGRDMCISCAWLYDFIQAQGLVDLDFTPRQSIYRDFTRPACSSCQGRGFTNYECPDCGGSGNSDIEPIMICTRCGVEETRVTQPVCQRCEDAEDITTDQLAEYRRLREPDGD